MTGLEGVAAGAAVRGATAAARHLAKTSEFERLCKRLADRFEFLGWSEAQFAAWADDGAFSAALGTYLDPPHRSDRQALAAAILPLVGAVDADTSAADFAERLVVAIEEEVRLAKQGDSLVRAEVDRLERVVVERGAGGPPNNTADAIDHLDGVGNYLQKRDPYFSYAAVTHEAGGPAPPVTPNTVLSYEQTSGGSTSRIDAVPISDDAMERYGPALSLRPVDGPEGERAAKLLRSALEDGTTVEIGEGLTVEFTRLPPAFSEVVGKPIAGRIQVGPSEPVTPRPVRPWFARLRGRTNRGRASIDIDLHDSSPPHRGWDVEMTGSFGGLVVTALIRTHARAGGGEIRLRFEYTRDQSPLSEQVAALRFLYAISGTGTLELGHRADLKLPSLRFVTTTDDAHPDEQSTLAFLEDVLTIQEWTGIEFDVPELVDGPGVRAVAHVAYMVRKRGQRISWTRWRATVPERYLPLFQRGGVIRVTETATATVLDKVVELGTTAVEFKGFSIVTATPSATTGDGYLDIEVQPKGGGSRKAFQHLFRDDVPVRLPGERPPPPPRGRRKKRRRSRGK